MATWLTIPADRYTSDPWDRVTAYSDPIDALTVANATYDEGDHARLVAVSVDDGETVSDALKRLRGVPS